MLLSVSALTLFLGLSLASDHFLYCDQTKPLFMEWAPYECCENEPQLPKGCECYSINARSGYTNSAGYFPMCPSVMGARMLLYTDRNKEEYQQITVGDGSIEKSHFGPGKPLKVVVHGFTNKAPCDWTTAIKDGILKDTKDVNVVVVDWRKGASLSYGFYMQPVANVRVVGSMVAALVIELVNSGLVQLKDVHLIGHSLGAHVAGMAGKEVIEILGDKVGRITGLDPAGPMYEKYEPWVLLGQDDAVFVDNIHTDAQGNGGIGITRSVGDVDFWVNGGRNQPGCMAAIWNLCSHVRAILVFIDSLGKCPYNMGDACRMGYYADSAKCSGDYIFNTTATEPYCLAK